MALIRTPNTYFALVCVAVELASAFGWERCVGAHGVVIGMTSFGESAPLQSLQKRFGFTPDRLASRRNC